MMPQRKAPAVFQHDGLDDLIFFVYSNAFFEASLLSCCADNLLFTDAKHTDAVFHR